MDNFENMLSEYARLVVKVGVNLQQDQRLVISSPIECADFARLIAKEAFAAGAWDVSYNWSDEKAAKIRYEMGRKEIFEEFPQWLQDKYMYNSDKGSAFVSIHASDPEIFKNVDPEKLLTAQRASGNALAEYRRRMMNNENCWCVVSIPTLSWAKKVFALYKDEVAVRKLWKAIFATVRIDGANDPVEAWQKHTDFLQKAADFLNAQNFVSLKYKNELGTDFSIGLPEGHIWAGGAEWSAYGTRFVANMPTEEVFTLPDMNSANGVVCASKPLVYHGQLIENMKLTFENGKVIKAEATAGQEALDSLLATDEGAVRLGEVALVPYDSPISNTGILFYNTLFDENAACHLAFGKAYPTCIQGSDKMDKLELAQHGVNDSLVHEDFMIGTADLSIVGVKADGTEVPVFVNGNFVEF